MKEIDFVIMGTIAQLSELNEEDIHVSLDLEEFTRTGTYKETLDVELPKDYSLMENKEVEFRLVKRAAAGNK